MAEYFAKIMVSQKINFKKNTPASNGRWPSDRRSLKMMVRPKVDGLESYLIFLKDRPVFEIWTDHFLISGLFTFLDRLL